MNNQTNLQDFKQYLINNNMSLNTIKSYTKDIAEYLTLFPTLSRENIIQYKVTLKDNSFSSETFNRKLSSLKKYNQYLMENNIVPGIFITKSDYMNIQTKYISPNNLDDKDIIKFFAKVEKEESKRNIALIYLILSTGIRRFEAVDIKLKHLNLKQGELIISDGKGNKQREVLLHSEVVFKLKDYIDNERGNSSYAEGSEYLFVSQRANKLIKETVNAIISPYGKEKITPHKLRHFWCSNAAKSMELVKVAYLAGHSSIQTTTRYTHPNKKEMKREIEKCKVI